MGGNSNRQREEVITRVECDLYNSIVCGVAWNAVFVDHCEVRGQAVKIERVECCDAPPTSLPNALYIDLGVCVTI